MLFLVTGVVVGDNVGMQGFSDPRRELLDADSVTGHLLPTGSVFGFLAEHLWRCSRRRCSPICSPPGGAGPVWPRMWSRRVDEDRNRWRVVGEVTVSGRAWQALVVSVTDTAGHGRTQRDTDFSLLAVRSWWGLQDH